jgi:hypothetical protein
MQAVASAELPSHISHDKVLVIARELIPESKAA